LELESDEELGEEDCQKSNHSFLELESDEELGEEDCQKSNHSFLDLDSAIKSGGSKVLDSLDNCHYEPKLAGRK
jgi:hypothetical protein